MPQSLLRSLPDARIQEVFECLVDRGNLRIERIVSQGQATPQGEWYDQEEHEWVLVLSGFGILEFESGESVRLDAGDALLLPAHTRHRVAETASTEPTVWVAVFWRD